MYIYSFGVSLASSTPVHIINNTRHFLTELFSAKQNIRPSFLYEDIREAIPSIKAISNHYIWKIASCFHQVMGKKGDEIYHSHVKAIETLFDFSQGKNSISKDRADSLKQLFFSSSGNLNLFNEMRPFFKSIKRESLSKFYCQCHLMLSILNEDTAVVLSNKISLIKKEIENPSHHSFSDQEKLTPTDFFTLHYSKSNLKILESLKNTDLDLPYLDILIGKWGQIAALYESKAIHELREIHLKQLSEGRIFLGNRVVRFGLMGATLGFFGVIKQIFQGKLCHMAIVVKNDQNMLSLSHVQIEAKSHAITPLQDPLFLAFHQMIDLDIASLIPSGISQSDHLKLREVFKESLVKYAKEQHPEVHSASMRTYLYSFLFGSISSNRTPLENISFKPKQEEMCSSYVAKIFLMALNDVNLALKHLGYQEIIPHPFGENEKIEWMDCLRVLYKLKECKVYRSEPLHPTISKIIKVSHWEF